MHPPQTTPTGLRERVRYQRGPLLDRQPMRKALILYNPQSGQRNRRLDTATERAAEVLREAGIEVTVRATVSAAEAGQQAREAVCEGYDTIFACGGDGTIQDVAQGLVGSRAALGIIPLGTANALAHDLGIPSDASAAARLALRALPRRIAVGKADYHRADGSLATRYFLSVAGAGQDATLIHQLKSGDKRSFGIAAYFLKALQVWLTHRPQWLSASLSGDVEPRPQQVTQLLAVRIHDFGNLLRDLAPGASLLRQDFRVVLFKTSSRWAYLLYVLRGIAGANSAIAGVETTYANAIRLASASSSSPVYLEADGELLGQLPAEISIVPDALTLLVPPDFASRRPG